MQVIPLTDTDADELQAIQKEIAFLAGCNHPNIVKYLVRAPSAPLDLAASLQCFERLSETWCPAYCTFLTPMTCLLSCGCRAATATAVSFGL